MKQDNLMTRASARVSHLDGAFRLCVIGLVAAVLLLAPLQAQSVTKGPKKPLSLQEAKFLFDGMDKEIAVQAAYEKYGQYVQGSGGEISFELFNFQSLGVDELDQVYWSGLFTFPAGRVIESVVTQVGEDAVHVDSKWIDLNSNGELLKMTREVANLKARGAHQRLIEHDAEFYSRLVGLTTYDVIVEFEGESRTYTASFLWLPLRADAVRYVVLDQVVPQLKDVIREKLPAITKAELTARLTPSSSEGRAITRKSQCVDGPSTTDTFPGLVFPRDTTGHDPMSNGFHSSAMTPKRTCDTMADCSSICTPGYNTVFSCLENQAGLPTGWKHQKSLRWYLEADQKINAKASCHVGLGCAVDACLIGSCQGVSFSATGKGLTFNLSASRIVIGDMSLKQGMECPKATEVPDPGGDDPDDDEEDVRDGGGGGGGGGGPAPPGCEWFCVGVWDPQTLEYTEECTLIC